MDEPIPLRETKIGVLLFSIYSSSNNYCPYCAMPEHVHSVVSCDLVELRKDIHSMEMSEFMVKWFSRHD